MSAALLGQVVIVTVAGRGTGRWLPGGVDARLVSKTDKLDGPRPETGTPPTVWIPPGKCATIASCRGPG